MTLALLFYIENKSNPSLTLIFHFFTRELNKKLLFLHPKND